MVGDSESDTCLVCDDRIGMLSRHHCRHCGALVCGACSKNSRPLHHLIAGHMPSTLRCCSSCMRVRESLNESCTALTLALRPDEQGPAIRHFPRMASQLTSLRTISVVGVCHFPDLPNELQGLNQVSPHETCD